MADTKPQGPYKLVTVNTAPERAKLLIGRVIQAVKAEYTIIHAANVATIDEVQQTVSQIQPDFLCCASMWTPEESDRIQAITRETSPGTKTMAIPQGMQAQQGPDAVVEFLVQKFPELIRS